MQAQGHRDRGRVRRSLGELDDGPELKRKRAQCRKKSVSGGIKEEDGDAKERRGHERERRSPLGTGGYRESLLSEDRGGQSKQHSQKTQSFGIELESCSSVAVRHDNPEEKN
ncbi:hypothetical protein NDU88_002506 [Pleurodeles waltl]|uniref:Uncharacterized protein n=1 Tax=Pleurodeles waltl TaxID=8319 RepID=A0AAV7VBE4_PLEWA|nr:hypothetical protein NDU88_002506 [Pleurodeles waltl]